MSIEPITSPTEKPPEPKEEPKTLPPPVPEKLEVEPQKEVNPMEERIAKMEARWNALDEKEKLLAEQSKEIKKEADHEQTIERQKIPDTPQAETGKSEPVKGGTKGASQSGDGNGPGRTHRYHFRKSKPKPGK